MRVTGFVDLFLANDHDDDGEHSVIELLHSLHEKVDRLMTTEAELQTTLDAIKDGVAIAVSKLTAQAQTIADLQAQVTAGTPVSQEQLDALKAEADAILASLPTA